MNRFCWLLVISLIIAFCTTAATAAVERSVASETDGTLTVRLTLPAGWIGGITEVIPSGFTYVGSTHPADQVAINGNNLHFAVIEEEEILYTLKGAGMPEIRGSVLNLTTGGEPAPSATAAPSAPFIPLAAIIILLLFLAWRRLR